MEAVSLGMMEYEGDYGPQRQQHQLKSEESMDSEIIDTDESPLNFDLYSDSESDSDPLTYSSFTMKHKRFLGKLST